MFGGGSSGSSSGVGGGGGGREVHNLGGSSSYAQHQHQMNMNMLLSPTSFQQHLLSPTASVGGGGGGGVGGCDDDDFPRRDERVVQWGNQETREFIAIRGELEAEFTVTKRNKSLWEVVAAKMKDLGYRRTPDQCKCKWKNLVNRYKGKETADQDNGHQFPFFDELHAVFTAKADQLQQLVHEPEAGLIQSRKRARKVHGDESSEEFSEDAEDDNESEEDRLQGNFAQKRKVEKEKRQRPVASVKSSRQLIKTNPSNNGNALVGIQEILKNFLQQQQRIETQWKESMEKSAREREQFEQEWRQAMENHRKERIIQEQAWRKRDEERRAREESRAEKRDALLTALLKKLIQEN